MKLPIILMAVLSLAAAAQTNKPASIAGSMTIKFDSRIRADTEGVPDKGITDKYSLTLTVNDSVRLKGDIFNLPYIGGSFGGAAQNAVMKYLLECEVINPADPAQSKNIGRLYGLVPVDVTGLYRFDDGSLKFGILSTGRGQAFDSKFRGTAQGKPLAKSTGFLSQLKREALNIKRTINGKTVSIAVTKYDKMTFNNHVLAMGPVQKYPEATVTGDMVYDYARMIWYFTGLVISYQFDGRQMADKVTGNIRWTESPTRKTDGKGEYQFDVRLNEPPPGEASVFAGASDESAFFQTDDTLSSLTGMMKYVDKIVGESVVGSDVTINLTGNKLSPQQTMNLAKLVMISAVVPMNAE